jgi:hypothetical protein
MALFDFDAKDQRPARFAARMPIRAPDQYACTALRTRKRHELKRARANSTIFSIMSV